MTASSLLRRPTARAQRERSAESIRRPPLGAFRQSRGLFKRPKAEKSPTSPGPPQPLALSARGLFKQVSTVGLLQAMSNLLVLNVSRTLGNSELQHLRFNLRGAVNMFVVS